MQLLSQAGIRWARVHADWSVTVGRWDGTKGRIPAVVLCSRDRRGSHGYIEAVCLGKPPGAVEIELDEVDKELSDMVKQWKA